MNISDAFQIMTKPTGAICNLDCEYCYYLEKEKLYSKKQNWAMPDDVLESYIRQYIALQKIPEVTFVWQGGEPTLLGVDYFRRVAALQKKYADGKKILNSFQTNGLLLNGEWGDFFAENNFLIGLSIDGPEEIHDRYRVLKGGQPSYEKVMKGLEILKKFNVEFNTLTCLHKKNSDKPLEVYKFLKKIGSGFIQFIPIVERRAAETNREELSLVLPNYSKEAQVTDWSVEPEQFGNFLIAIFNEWIRKDVGKYFVQVFDVALEAWYGVQPSLCVFNETCGRALAMEHNGDLFSCDHYVYKENKLGNILEQTMDSLVNSGKQIKFGIDKKMTLPQYCRECSVKFVCNGECPKHRFIKTPDGEEGLNYLCAGYKKFFTHINPAMKFMVNELQNNRPPANVMKWARKNKIYR